MTRPVEPLTEDQLLAYFEGAMPDAEARLFAAQLAEDPAARDTLAAWSAQNDALATLYPVNGDAPIPARLTDVIRQAR
ncbi:MAG: anti-sigma factor family protein, partial [Paracoccaceae bacterium]